MASSVEVARAPLLDQGPVDEPRPRHDDEDAEVDQVLEETDDAQPRKKRRVIQSSDKSTSARRTTVGSGIREQNICIGISSIVRP